jgi:hypothetical protein
MDTPRTRSRSQPSPPPRTTFAPVATVEIDAVTPSSHGFSLTGRGAGAGTDRAEYRVDMHFDLPLDPRTRSVLGELLSQSDLTVYRRDGPGRNS